MARSLRSKVRRENNREKRVRYGKKELAKLQTLVKNRETREQLMNELTQVTIKKEPGDESKPIEGQVTAKRETKELTSEYNPFTLLNSHGNYPKWMNKRKLRRIVHKRKRNRQIKKQNKNKSSI